MNVYNFLLYLIPGLFAITVHEVAHGYVAYRLGDHTAYRLGRLTLNPLAHIDPIGTLLLPVTTFILTGFVFGWAKPIPVQPSRLRYGNKSMVWVALAGPFSNMLMAIAWAFLGLAARHEWMGSLSSGLLSMSLIGIQLNLMLMIFNLLPIPPLDGSRVVERFLKGAMLHQWHRMEAYGFYIILALNFIPGLLALWFLPWKAAFQWIPGIVTLF